MALALPVLTNALVAALSKPNDSAAAAAQAIADAYTTYAQGGQFLASTLAPLDAQGKVLAATLLTGFSSLTLLGGCTGFETGLIAFWTGAIIIGAAPGATVNCPGAIGLSNIIAAAFASPQPSGEVAAQVLATILDTATRTVIGSVTIPGPPPVVTPTPII